MEKTDDVLGRHTESTVSSFQNKKTSVFVLFDSVMYILYVYIYIR